MQTNEKGGMRFGRWHGKRPLCVAMGAGGIKKDNESNDGRRCDSRRTMRE